MTDVYLNQAGEAVNINVLSNDSSVLLVLHMLLLVILRVYAKDPFSLKIQHSYEQK
jgi:hypothetical protein